MVENVPSGGGHVTNYVTNAHPDADKFSQVAEDIGGPEGARTPDPLVANQVLSQLSYRPGGIADSGLEIADCQRLALSEPCWQTASLTSY